MIELNRIYTGDCIEVMKTWPANFVDTIITDPPYGIRFMGKAWDGADIEKTVQMKRRKNTFPPGGRHGLATKDGRAFAAGTYDQSLKGNAAFQAWCAEWGASALRIAKPGATMLIFGGTRTFHRMTAGLEDSGWEIRDCMMWLYGSGFPKSHNLHGKFEGWGTALKPAWEPIIVAMKPLDGTFAENAEKCGVAGINVDGGRIGVSDTRRKPSKNPTAFGLMNDDSWQPKPVETGSARGRWPANLILDEEAAAMLDGQSGELKSGSGQKSNREKDSTGYGRMGRELSEWTSSVGGASRFFYCAKSAKAERNNGCETIGERESGVKNSSGRGFSKNDPYKKILNSNNHPTVKPLSLMKYLCALTMTPTGGIVLDPFAGSGTTLLAAESHNRPWVGIEVNPEYILIARARIARESSQMKMAI